MKTPISAEPAPVLQKGNLGRNRRRVAPPNAIHFRFPLPRQRFLCPARARVVFGVSSSVICERHDFSGKLSPLPSPLTINPSPSPTAPSLIRSHPSSPVFFISPNKSKSTPEEVWFRDPRQLWKAPRMPRARSRSGFLFPETRHNTLERLPR